MTLGTALTLVLLISGQQDNFDRRIEVRPRIAQMSALLRSNGDGAARYFADLLHPKGLSVSTTRIKPEEVLDAELRVSSVFRKVLTGEPRMISWRGITNSALVDEQLLAEWEQTDCNVTWIDVEGNTAVLIVDLRNELVPLASEGATAQLMQEWLLNHTNVPTPLAAKYHFGKYSTIVEGERSFVYGWFALPDDVANDLLKTLPAEDRWWLSMQFCADENTFVLQVPIHWITTKSVWARKKPHDKDGKPISRFLGN